MFQILGGKTWSCGFWSIRNKIRITTSKCCGGKWAAPWPQRLSQCPERGQRCGPTQCAQPLLTWPVSTCLFSFCPPYSVSAL